MAGPPRGQGRAPGRPLAKAVPAALVPRPRARARGLLILSRPTAFAPVAKPPAASGYSSKAGRSTAGAALLEAMAEWARRLAELEARPGGISLDGGAAAATLRGRGGRRPGPRGARGRGGAPTTPAPC